jgi:hypothetical protein
VIGSKSQPASNPQQPSRSNPLNGHRATQPACHGVSRPALTISQTKVSPQPQRQERTHKKGRGNACGKKTGRSFPISGHDHATFTGRSRVPLIYLNSDFSSERELRECCLLFRFDDASWLASRVRSKALAPNRKEVCHAVCSGFFRGNRAALHDIG